MKKRINHREVCSDGDDCTNQAESFFSRMRRAEIAFTTGWPFIWPYAGDGMARG